MPLVRPQIPPKFTFDIDVSPENPYTAAQRFLASHDLPMSYLDEVVRFIEKNTSGVNLSSGNEYSDPFTGELPVHITVRHLGLLLTRGPGASRYQASSNLASSAYSGSSDPFTGASRYQAQPSQAASSSGHGDPLTGGTRYTPSGSSTSSAPAAKPTVIPVVSFPLSLDLLTFSRPQCSQHSYLSSKGTSRLCGKRSWN